MRAGAGRKGFTQLQFQVNSVRLRMRKLAHAEARAIHPYSLIHSSFLAYACFIAGICYDLERRFLCLHLMSKGHYHCHCTWKMSVRVHLYPAFTHEKESCVGKRATG